MKNTYTNKLAVAVLVASLASLSLSVSAGQDESQRYITQQLHKKLQQTKAQNKANEVATGIEAIECKKMMEDGKNPSGV